MLQNHWIALICLGVAGLMALWSCLIVRKRPEPSDRLNIPSRFFLIALRVVIGWHFLIEGLDKLHAPNWSSEVYLRESVGPAAPLFRQIAGDTLVAKLTPGKTDISPALENDWVDYYDAFVVHYALEPEQKNLADTNFAQAKANMKSWLTGSSKSVERLFLVPPTLPKTMTIPERLEDLQRLENELQEVEANLSAVPEGTDLGVLDKDFRASRVRLLKQNEEKSKTDPDDATKKEMAKTKKDLDDLKKLELELRDQASKGAKGREQLRWSRYLAAKANINRWRAELKADLDEQTSLMKTTILNGAEERKKLSASLVGKYVIHFPPSMLALQASSVPLALSNALFGTYGMAGEILYPDTFKVVLSSDQERKLPPVDGPLALKRWTMLDWSNHLVKFGLIGIGCCLIVGLFSRFSAFLGAGLLLMFFLAMPPLPWYPDNPKAEGHYLFINKNVIEMLALLVLATLPTGRWVGLDAMGRLIFPGKTPKATEPAATV